MAPGRGHGRWGGSGESMAAAQASSGSAVALTAAGVGRGSDAPVGSAGPVSGMGADNRMNARKE